MSEHDDPTLAILRAIKEDIAVSGATSPTSGGG